MSGMNNKIEEIMQELRDHNAAIGAEPREEDRLRSDARCIDMVRKGGLSVETLAMMLTDATFALKESKSVTLPAKTVEAMREVVEAAVEWANVFCDPDKTKREQYQAGVKLCGPIGLYEGIMQQKEANQ